MSGVTLEANAEWSDRQPFDERLYCHIAEALAAAEGVAVDEVDPIQEFVDLEAVARLVESGDANLWVGWSMDGTRVEIDGTGTVRVEGEGVVHVA